MSTRSTGRTSNPFTQKAKRLAGDKPNPFAGKKNDLLRNLKPSTLSPHTPLEPQGEVVAVKQLKPGDRLWLIYQWGPIMAGDTMGEPFAIQGKLLYIDQYNIVLETAGKSKYPIPIGTIRKPDWLRRVK